MAIWIREWTAITVCALLAAGCSARVGGPPDIVADRTACSHCTMLVSEMAYAAAYQVPGADARVFDDIGCMLEVMRRAGLRAGGDTRLWFHDAGDREWIENGGAVFVRSSEIRTPMGGGIVAYRDAKRAEEAAARFHGDVVPAIAELVAVKGEQ